MIYPGAENRISVTFRRTDTGQLADPTTVALSVRNPCHVESSYAYPGQIVRDGLGAYHYDLAIPKTAESEGEWKFRWEGGGAAIGVTEGRFVVRCSAFTD